MDVLLAHCTAVFSQHGGMFVVFFLGGLTGSIVHCLAMCGPVVACQAACGGGCGKRMDTASQWRYHAGRMLTYGALGFVAAFLSKQIVTLLAWPYISSAMLVLAGGMFIASAFPFYKHHSFTVSARHHFLRGVFMGFMPCGLLYAALMMAATLANPVSGMVAMWMFTLGTVPALLVASAGADLLTRKWQHTMHHLGRAVMAFNGLSLWVMAARGIR